MAGQRNAGVWMALVLLAGSHTLQARAETPIVAAATRTYHYDQHQQLCKVVEPETGATLMGYDGAGNLAWSATGLPGSTACDPEGDTAAILARRAVRTYDARNRITALDFADGQADVTYGYTATGQLATITAYNGGNYLVTTDYTYSRRGLPIQEKLTWNNLAWPTDYGYDANGHLSTLGHPAGVTVAYAPNALGQPTQAGSYATGVSYYPNGAMKQFTYGNGIVHTLERNARGLPDRSIDAYGTTKILDDGYDYDANGNVAAISDGATGRNQRGNRTMAYDGLNRLTSVQSPMYGTTGASYQYDTLDNLRHVVAPGRDHYYCYDGSNRLTNVKTGGCSGATVVGLGYDLQGNLANRNGVLYTFDQGNRLRQVNNPVSTYLYDGHGRRFRDVTGASRYQVYSLSGQLVFAQNNRQSEQYWYISLNGSLVAIRERNYSTNVYTTTYQHTDALGSPVAVTNASRTVIQRSEYEPYGKLVNRAMEDGPGYTGHMSDAATGLVYMQQRYYDPSIDGRFLSVDPVTASSPGGTFNRYWYANANPYRFTDPDGRKVKSYQLNTCGVSGCDEGSFTSDQSRKQSEWDEEVGRLREARGAMTRTAEEQEEILEYAGEEAAWWMVPWGKLLRKISIAAKWGGKSIDDLLRPGGQLIGKVGQGATPNIRTITAREFSSLQQNLLRGAKPAGTYAGGKGTWYALPTGGRVGVRRSENHGLTLDIDIPGFPRDLKVHQQ